MILATDRVDVLGPTAAAQAAADRTPLFLCPVPAGFPSPADDFVERQLDLNEYLIRNAPATFLVRVTGESMVGAGIEDGDILVVDRSLTPEDGRIVVAVLDGELTVKRLRLRGGRTCLVAESGQHLAVEFDEETEFTVWGIVTFAVRQL